MGGWQGVCKGDPARRPGGKKTAVTKPGSSKRKAPTLHSKRREHPDEKCPEHPDKDWRPLVRGAWDAGWWCVRRKKYIYCYALNGDDIVKVPMTPSDHRTIRNVRAHFARAGLDL